MSAPTRCSHILAFGALGLLPPSMRTTGWRIRGLATALTCAIVVEMIQIPIHDRTASLSDLCASFVGAFAGFGFCAAATTTLGLASPRSHGRRNRCAPASRVRKSA